ncbi:three-helix bundle dimerization domain-containing protein [Kibdelosporangium aridum]|uniref:HDIG domain-containing protein n=1 Tax=Kibdelosporangium aridum TaxID=2030 RepID=A0A1W2FK89_KIBAR|nr:HD domain-containing protein [Kibdelosporangium aridum]SMD22385.1 HDIG domain-containing protein [Kibdelosporangium aridum]
MSAAVRRRQTDKQIRRLENRLLREHDRVPPSLVHEWVQQAHARLGDAPVQDFVPLLVERAVRASARDFPADSPGMTGTCLSNWARNTARRLLAQHLPRRWAHTEGVARRAEQVARVLAPADQDLLVAAAWLHDIGYAPEVANTGLHSLDGAQYLLRAGVSRRLCGLVAYHSGAAAVAQLLGFADDLAEFEDDRGRLRDALWYCDMTTGPDGHPTTVDDRIAEIHQRRGPDDPVVRALAINLDERLAAVRRTHRLLRRTAA